MSSFLLIFKCFTNWFLLLFIYLALPLLALEEWSYIAFGNNTSDHLFITSITASFTVPKRPNSTFYRNKSRPYWYIGISKDGSGHTDLVCGLYYDVASEEYTIYCQDQTFPGVQPFDQLYVNISFVSGIWYMNIRNDKADQVEMAAELSNTFSVPQVVLGIGVDSWKNVTCDIFPTDNELKIEQIQIQSGLSVLIPEWCTYQGKSYCNSSSLSLNSSTILLRWNYTWIPSELSNPNPAIFWAPLVGVTAFGFCFACIYYHRSRKKIVSGPSLAVQAPLLACRHCSGLRKLDVSCSNCNGGSVTKNMESEGKGEKTKVCAEIEKCLFCDGTGKITVACVYC